MLWGRLLKKWRRVNRYVQYVCIVLLVRVCACVCVWCSVSACVCGVVSVHVCVV